MSCKGNCCEDIHTLHAELTHQAAEVSFPTEYNYNGSNASIVGIASGSVQSVIEDYISKVGIPVKHELLNDQTGCNLHFRTEYEFIPGSLEVFLSGINLNGNQSDPRRDFTVDPDNQGFTIEIDPLDRERLNAPPQGGEPFHVNYNRRIAFNTFGGS